MNPQDRVKRYAQLAAAAGLLVWILLCYFLLLSPKRAALAGVSQQLSDSSTKLAEMKREIEDASIAGPLPVGASRFDKFGILGYEEEQLFLSDLIDFCTETENVLNLVRRADISRPARTETEEQQRARGGRPASGPEDVAVPQPVVERVPHTVSFTGGFLASFHLLRKLESYKRLLSVERVELGTDSRRGYPNLNGTITIDLYLVKNAVPPPVEAAGEQEGEAERRSGQRAADRQPEQRSASAQEADDDV
jgi:hypothetical protein